MLTELRIENFAIIQKLELNLEAGLSTFTGETGAGKSIILDAILALMGGRTDSAQIRSGADRAVLEATFRISPQNQTEIHAILQREDLLDEPDYLMLSREIRREGRNIARVNGRSVNFSLLRELGEYLVDIHGQSEHLSLLNVRNHLGLLDRYADTAKEIGDYRRLFQKIQEVRRELIDLRKQEADAARRVELLRYQVEEIDSARLQVGEEKNLRLERDRLANAESLAEEAQRSLILLEDGDGEMPSITDLLGQVVQSMTALCRIDPTKGNLLNQVESTLETLTDIGKDLRTYLEETEFNPRRLDAIEERLGLIENLKRKYGGSIESVLAYAHQAKTQLEKIANASETITKLETEQQKLFSQILTCAQALSGKRKKAAESLAKAVENELRDLRMEGARFMVEILLFTERGNSLVDPQTQTVFTDSGIDHVEFLIAPNPGEGYKPLVKIASGGETSRLMLALKNVLAQADTIPTLIFDEIDQGIGGRVGMVVGEKLWQLSRKHQVLCVTHLPQLAVYGDHHFGVRKLVEEGRTLTQVIPLQKEERIEELAQMMGKLSEANRKAAMDILNSAAQRVQEMSR